MGVIERDIECVAVRDHEEDYLDIDRTRYATIAELVCEAAGVDVSVGAVRVGDLHAFSRAAPSGTYYADRQLHYRASTGRQYPPVYRVKVRVEAEKLSPEDTAAYWERRRQ